MNLYRLDRRLFTGCAIAAIALLSACGGSGGAPVSSTPNPTPTPTPTPTPAPTPTPTPTPISSFNTEEFRSSDGPDFHNAVTAWSEGIAGQGSTIAVIDTGIDSDSPEFAGRLSSASTDLAGSRGVDNPDDDHGTNVAMVAAAARDNTGILGIAWDATIIAFRADTPGTCTDPDGCSFDDRDIAAGVDAAVSNGATVINLSLGGDPPSQELVGAVSRAANAGVVVVVSAGNDGDSNDPAIDPDNPDPFAAGLVAAGNGNVIIVGSVDAAGVISDFSNRAGGSASVFITARGEAICCTYKDGVLDVQTNPTGIFVSGTSFSAPQVSGAVALLAQAFPNLTASQIVDIILSSARDAGAAGTDAIYGTGILDIARAFAPQGTTTLANTTVAIQPGAPGGTTSGPMGDALTHAYLPAIVTDAYNRAYVYDVGRSLAAAAMRRTLQGAVGSNDRQLGSTIDRLSLAFTVSGDDPGNLARLQLAPADAEIARVLAARAALRIAPGTQLAFGYAQGADGLVMQLQGQHSPAFLIAGEGRGNDGFVRRSDASFAVRQQIGHWGLTLSADSGRAWNTAGQLVGPRFGADRRRRALRGFGVAADRQFGPVAAVLGLNWLSEDETVLGASFEGPLGRPGANSLFIDASAAVRLARDWRLGGSFRQGFTRAEATQFVTAGSHLASQAWSLDLSHAGTFAGGDTLGLRISQPLRVSGGGLNLYLPVSYDYGSESATFGIRRLSLAPTGREVDGEIAWRGPLWGGEAAASLFYRTDPGHDSRLPDDRGVAVKWNKRF